MTPTARELRYWREMGYVAAVVERWNCFSQTRHDLFGMFDIVAYDADDTIGIQVTTGTNHNKRVTKITTNPNLRRWLVGPGRRAVVASWAPRKVKRGGKAVRYHRRGQELEAF